MSEEDNSWVFDSLVAFLNGSIWNAPLQSFIEEKSLIFEPNETENEEYKNIFEEFKNLVDFMLGNFMEDIGITPDQFQDACAEGRRYQVPFDNNIFEQIWAANDYDMFVRMMTHRNVELQLQALELIEKKYGITPQLFIPNNNGEGETQKSENRTTFPVTIENESKLEKEVLAEVAKKFSVDEPSTSANEIENLIEQKPILEQKLKETIEKSQRVELKPVKVPNAKKADTEGGEDFKPKVEAKQSSQPEERKLKEIDAIELKKRQDYLKAQRDKLVALKKEARQKQLTTETGPKSKNRPKSAKAAEAVLTGQKSSIEASQMQIRKTLAERLKAEVVDKDIKDKIVKFEIPGMESDIILLDYELSEK